MQRVIGCACLLLCAANALAQGHWFVSGGAGVTFPRTSDNNAISSGPGWPNDNYSNDGVDSAVLLDVAAGYQWQHRHAWLPYYSVGGNYLYAFPAKVKGTVDQYSLPQFENYNYQYKVQTQTFLAIAKVDIYDWCGLMPFVMAGAGASLNNASNYSESAVPNVTARTNPGFKGQTNTYFSYALGAGLDYRIQPNVWVSLQYTYLDLGHVQTGAGDNTVMLTGLNYASSHLKNRLTSNTVILNVTYLFDSRA